jgi:outer membrane receptor for ferrienterochelin and colicins
MCPMLNNLGVARHYRIVPVLVAALGPLAAETGKAQAGVALAEAVPEAIAAPGGTIAYGQDFFAGYNVQNAQDMLRLIPGVSSILSSLGSGSQERGFGSGGDQILVNGRRFPGKSNDISGTLARLRADTVDRVELIRGANSDIDVQSEGVVVNIVLKEGASLAGGGTFEIAARGNDQGAFDIDGLVSYSGSIGNLGYNVGIERNAWSPSNRNMGRWSNRFRDEIFFFPSGEIQELRPQRWTREFEQWIVTTGLTYDLPDDIRIQLNGLYETEDVTEFNRLDVTRFNLAGEQIDALQELQGQREGLEKTWEVSSEMTAPLWGGGLTALFLINDDRNPSLDYRERTRGNSVSQVSRTRIFAHHMEYIGRIQYNFSVSDELSINAGAEASHNRLRQDLVSELDLNGDGQLENIVVPTSNAIVMEDRIEGFSEARWAPSSLLSVSASLNLEWSDLTTNSVFNPGRSLQFLKPRLDIRHEIGASGQLRVMIEKQVSQLDFNNFVPSYEPLDDRIDAGNPGLLPEQIWRFETVYEHRLANDAGVVEGKLFYETISNAIDSIPLQQGPVLVSAQGNLGDAWRYGFEMDASLRLGMIGLNDAILTVSGDLEKSRVTDPFTLVPRRLGEDRQYEFSIGFRHDIRSVDLSYGFDYEHPGTFRIQSDLFSRDRVRNGSDLSAFAEKRLSGSLTLRAEAQNLLGSRQRREREFFTIDQIDGAIRRRGSFEETRDMRYAIQLKGAF